MQASNNIEKMLKNYHFSDLTTMTDHDGDVMVFQVDSKYGNGEEILVRVIDGMYVTYTDCYMHHGPAVNTDGYQGIISMYQVFDGEAQINFKNNTACFIKKNDIVNFAGNAEFESTTVYRSSHVAAGLLCCYEELLSSLTDLNLDTTMFKEYYLNVSSYKDVLIYNSDLQFSDIAKQLKEAILDHNMFFIKAKALEMLYCGIANYSKYQDASKRKYNRKLLEQIARAKARIDQNLQEPFTITELAEYCEISPTYFKRIFKECFGVQPHRYLIQKRLEKSREMLAQTDLSILHISEAQGFVSSSRFSEIFKKEYGYLPSAYRREMKR
ncbi:MAG: AraC family transcriptional regulator [Lachnospiraceae bacterium]